MNTQLNDQAKKQAAIAKVISTMTNQQLCSWLVMALISPYCI
jgi:hypothetical protein